MSFINHGKRLKTSGVFRVIPVRQVLNAGALSVAMVSMASAQEVSLPGNASSLSESHGSWTVQCAIVPAADNTQTKPCAFSQQQVAQQTGNGR